MRLSRTDLVPVLAIIAGSAVGVLTSGSLLLSSRSDDVPVTLSTVTVPDGQRIVYWSSDGRIEYRPKEDFTRDTPLEARITFLQILASLNHPNIGHIYGLDEAEGQGRA